MNVVNESLRIIRRLLYAYVLETSGPVKGGGQCLVKQT
jgi:hypothetical protein